MPLMTASCFPEKCNMQSLFLQNASGNAAKAGLKNGDTIIYTSSFFGDELWPSDSANFTRSAISAAPSPVTITYVSTPPPFCRSRRQPPSPLRLEALEDYKTWDPQTYTCAEEMSAPVKRRQVIL